MNYLAHAHLSFNNPHWTVGNLLSDFIKGKKQYDFSAGIQQGIRLHRSIDAFTDAHAAVAEAKQVFRPAYRLYSGAVVDVVFDYFLATDPEHFATENELLRFSETVYAHLLAAMPQIPEALHPFFNHMRQQNWLYNYRHLAGIEKSLMGLVRRSQHLTSAGPALEVLQTHQQHLKQCYQQFYPTLVAHAKWFVQAHAGA
ncbi:MAG: DUF479 domain-containing protein [Bacteroidetes bacterium]|nr:MAG: DUF479 domain-containing protein [Bacteroidota bacterium]